MCLAISTPAVLPSVGRKTSAPRTCLTPLNTSPAPSPVNASRLPSRAARASLGAGAVRYAFTVTDFHRLPLAGLPAHPSRHDCYLRILSVASACRTTGMSPLPPIPKRSSLAMPSGQTRSRDGYAVRGGNVLAAAWLTQNSAACIGKIRNLCYKLGRRSDTAHGDERLIDDHDMLDSNLKDGKIFLFGFAVTH
jgi:hypothetical protein